MCRLFTSADQGGEPVAQGEGAAAGIAATTSRAREAQSDAVTAASADPRPGAKQVPLAGRVKLVDGYSVDVVDVLMSLRGA